MDSDSAQQDGSQYSELISGINNHKTDIIHAKGKTQNGDASQEDYNHLRAKRGQAISNHSLAERIRREKINERMKLLQDLVPGCNKVIAKAAMLDEIINYVQSLQKQVEFLSMKLASVNTELYPDNERIISDNLHSRYGELAIPGYGQSMCHSFLHSHGSSPQGILPAEMILGIPDPGEIPRAIDTHIFHMPQISSAHDKDLLVDGQWIS